MSSGKRSTRLHRATAIAILVFWVLFSPILLELIRSHNHVGRRIGMQKAHAAAAPQLSKTPKQSAPETTVKNLVLAWNRGDSEAVARMFLPEGVLILPNGSVIRSRSAIRKRLMEERKDRLKESTLSNTVEDISLVDASTASIKGKYVLNGMIVMGIKTSPAGAYVLRQKKHQGVWLIEKAEVLGKNVPHEKAKS
jgi:uncharacterized protein (TIGR02246 family)